MSSSFAGSKTIYDEEDIPKFGQLPFDHFVLEKWDVASTKSQLAQKADLVNAWLDLGSQGRLDAVWASGIVQLPIIPPGVPEKLQTSQQRAQAYNERPCTIWVRTWYGNEVVDREEADEDYKNLCEHVGEHAAEFIKGNWAFEDHEDLLADRTGAHTVTGATPPYVRELFGCYPDVLEGGGGLKTGSADYIWSGRGVGKQHLMMVVADKRACKTGAVLLLPINDYGKMTPGRLRVKPGEVHSFCVNWEDGQRLDENFRDGEEGEVDWFLGGDAWASPFIRVSPKD